VIFADGFSEEAVVFADTFSTGQEIILSVKGIDIPDPLSSHHRLTATHSH